MQLVRFRVDGRIGVGEITDDVVTEISTEHDLSTVLAAITRGDSVPLADNSFSIDEIEYLPPTTPENTVFAAALNYKSHINETAMAVPQWPLMFVMPYRALCGHRSTIPRYTAVTSELDYEAELAVIIGESVRNIEAKDALSFVAGYTILNDITARDVQFMEVGEHSRLDWFSGKCQQHSTPIGPTIVTSDAISNPSDLQIKSWVNGVKRQDESTELMIRDVSELIAFVSSRVELIPGDVITTGTPEGVGGWQDVLLTEGDTVEIEIEDLGRLENTVENVD